MQGTPSCFVLSAVVVAKSSKAVEIFRTIMFFPISNEKNDEEDLESFSTEKSGPCSS